jgi:hypothetical protein
VKALDDPRLRAKNDEVKALATELRTNAARYEREAQAVLGWVRGLRVSNDYLNNLAVACGAEVVKWKHLGLVASAAATYDRQKAVEAERAAEKAKRPASDWVGIQGQRLDMEMELLRAIAMPDNGYGESTVFKFVADSGAVVTWRTSSCPRVDRQPLEQGKRYRARFTVKGHGDFRDQRETRATRVKLEGIN